MALPSAGLAGCNLLTEAMKTRLQVFAGVPRGKRTDNDGVPKGVGALNITDLNHLLECAPSLVSSDFHPDLIVWDVALVPGQLVQPVYLKLTTFIRNYYIYVCAVGHNLQCFAYF